MLDSLGAVLPRAAGLYGDKTALAIDGREFTFAELDGLRTQNNCRPANLKSGCRNWKK